MARAYRCAAWVNVCGIRAAQRSGGPAASGEAPRSPVGSAALGPGMTSEPVCRRPEIGCRRRGVAWPCPWLPRAMYRRSIVNLMVRPCADRSGTSAAPLLAAVGWAFVVALTGCSRSSGTSGALAVPPRAGSTYTLMQMNLCLSGLAGCYGKVAYPAVVEEAVARIRKAHPDAVTFNEACRTDVALIARRTGYHLRFSRVIYLGAPLRCVQPGGRGLFGDAVLAKAAIESSDSQDFAAQAGIER